MRRKRRRAAAQVDQSIWLCLQAGFRRIVLRGDTDFSQTQYLDGWHALGMALMKIGRYPEAIEAAEQVHGVGLQRVPLYNPHRTR